MHDYEREMRPAAPPRDWLDLARAVGLSFIWIGAAILCATAATAAGSWLIEVLR